MTELRECPFCGSTDIGIYQFGIIPDASVRCESCGSSTDSEYSTVEEAVEAWNTRYEPTCTMEADEDAYSMVICSKCGYVEESLLFVPEDGPIEFTGKYCPNCGAKVIEE